MCCTDAQRNQTESEASACATRKVSRHINYKYPWAHIPETLFFIMWRELRSKSHALPLHFPLKEVSSQCQLRGGGEFVATDSEMLLKSWCERRDPETRRELIERHLPLVNALVRRFAGRGEQLDDLAQIGAIGLIKAVDRFDPRRGDSLAAYAIPTIQGEIRRHLRDGAQPLRLPRARRELRAHVAKRCDALTAEGGRPPTVAELAAETGRSVEEVGEALTPIRLVPLDGYAATARDRAAERRLELGEERALIESGLRTLGRRERRIVQLRYYGGLSQRGIAAEVGLSQVHVSRLLRESLGKLRHEIGQDSSQP
jgi:RNA polymerase sigma-B factor